MLEEEAGVMRNAMTTRAPCDAKKFPEPQHVWPAYYTYIEFCIQ